MTVLDAETTRGRLESWLAKARPDWSNISVAPLEHAHGAGWSAEIFFIDVSYTASGARQARSLAVRRQSSTYDLVLGGSLELQYKMIAAIEATGQVPISAAIGMENDASVLGAPFLVMGRIEGRAASQKPNYNVSGWLVDFTPQQRYDTWKNAIEAFASLHKLDWRQGFEFLNRPERGANGLDQYLHYIQEWFAWASKGRPLPIADAALAYVLKNKPDYTGDSVLWGDPTPSNTMFNNDGAVAALIDWELAAFGPGEIDLGWWLYFDELFSKGFHVERLPGLPTRDQVVSIYENAMGRKALNVEYFEILAGLRMAIVAVRQVDRQINLGNIKPDNKSLTENLMTSWLAKRLGLPAPELGPDFFEFMKHTTPVKEKEE